MPISLANLSNPLPPSSPPLSPPSSLSFPPPTRRQILNCSYHSWYPRYLAITPQSRSIALSPAFLAYLGADGIFLPPPSEERSPLAEHNSRDIGMDSGIFSTKRPQAEGAGADRVDREEEQEEDPSTAWPDIHHRVQDAIKKLKGAVYPKLNWSAPKDATWMNAGNTMECKSANEVYLLLKSSDFITHDLEEPFHGCIISKDEGQGNDESMINYHLILRQSIPAMAPSLEFRCFVRDRKLFCISQREMNYFPFLEALVPKLTSQIQKFFDDNLRDTFADENFVFDVYVPPPHNKCWLIDINPWAVRTDSLLFSWFEILEMSASTTRGTSSNAGSPLVEKRLEEEDGATIEFPSHPIFRLIKQGDPEAYTSSLSRYSAHRLPKEVVDASLGDFGGEGGVKAFLENWRDIIRDQEQEDSA